VRRRGACLLAVAILAGLAGAAHGDPPVSPDPVSKGFWHIGSPSFLTTSAGSRLELPANVYVLEEPKYDALDLALKKAEDDATRYKAEGDSLRKSLDGWQPGLWTLAGALAGGIVLGWYVHDKF
jgi:hypothetical protein